jgi:hypothetical protein
VGSRRYRLAGKARVLHRDEKREHPRHSHTNSCIEEHGSPKAAELTVHRCISPTRMGTMQFACTRRCSVGPFLPQFSRGCCAITHFTGNGSFVAADGEHRRLLRAISSRLLGPPPLYLSIYPSTHLCIFSRPAARDVSHRGT